MDEPRSIPELTAALKARNDEAVRLVVEMFQRRLESLAASKMPAAVKAKEDEGDIVGSVWRTVIRRIDAGKIVVANMDDLWSLLAQITVRKAARRNRKYLFTKKTSVNAEVHSGAGETDPVDGLLSREPPPEAASELVDLVEWVLTKVGDPTARQIVVMWLNEKKPAEIAEATGRSLATVFRVQRKVRNAIGRKFGLNVLPEDDPE